MVLGKPRSCKNWKRRTTLKFSNVCRQRVPGSRFFVEFLHRATVSIIICVGLGALVEDFVVVGLIDTTAERIGKR